MNTPLKIKVIIGSTRQNRFGDKPAHWIAEEAKKLEHAEVEVLDLRDYPLPFFNEPVPPSATKGKYSNEQIAVWAKKIDEADAYIVVTPEYNHGYSAVLKNAMDQMYYEWHNKPIAFVSYGSVGGARAVEQLRQVAIELQMAPIRQGVHIMAPWTLQDENGLKPSALDSYKDAADKLLQQLLWWTKALKTAREQN